jgi:glucose-6-phosphate isomerase
MMHLKVDPGKALSFIKKADYESTLKEAEDNRQTLLARTGKGNDFLGWLRLPSAFPADLLKRIRDDAAAAVENSELYVVIGIGGSYLGARAVIEALGPDFPALEHHRKNPLVVYAGQNLSEDYHAELLSILDSWSYSVAVISKSGTTTEPAVAFRLIKAHLEKKYGKEDAARRIIAITDASKGALKKMADREGYRTYVIPDDVGGRYSVLTPVGLLPIAVAGFDISRLLSGAREMEAYLQSVKSEQNPAVVYAAIRNTLYRAGKGVEIMVNYQPGLLYFTEWWKQLYGESEGKERKGIYPSGAGFTTDLHSLGQFIQEGSRSMFETVISIENPVREVRVPRQDEDTDGLNYLAGKRLSEVNRMAELGTLMAHVEGDVPNIRITVPRIDEEVLGQLIYFFEFACAVSGYTLGVNPFDQPGVEAYKNKMFQLLGKPGYK